MVLHELREQLRGIAPDIVFLQEVQGAHGSHAERHADWPAESQAEFLADSIWQDYAYGKNAVYPEGHHGNAILSRFPIISWQNIDVSAHRFEQRGMLHCVIDMPDQEKPLHCICVHMGLFAKGRRKQVHALRDHVRHQVPADEPLIIAGDYNDWRAEACHVLKRELHLKEAFEQMHGKPARSYPSSMPVLHLDRIYTRGLNVTSAHVHAGQPWSKISDHAPLSAVLSFP
jgi:endonuclease/exonuclease/phosphatase family metal-dependent hydrolase